MKIYPEMYHWTRKSPLNSGSSADLDPDLGIFGGILPLLAVLKDRHSWSEQLQSENPRVSEPQIERINWTRRRFAPSGCCCLALVCDYGDFDVA